MYLTATKEAAPNMNNDHKIKIQKEVSHEFISCGFILYTLTISVELITC